LLHRNNIFSLTALHFAFMKRKTSPQPKIALALSGGGPLGAIYEIGALCALQESLNGIDFTRLQHYVGVSAGGFIAAGLANGITPRELCNSFIENNSDEPPEAFDPSWLLSPAYGEFARRASMMPGLFASTLWQLSAGKKPFIHALEIMGAGLPTGVFSNEKIHTEMARLFSQEGRTNDFRLLKTQLTLVATNLDNGETAPFGRPGWDHVPISKAVQASSALPGLFPPVEIEGNYYVDGALKKTMHASVALDEGIDLLLCVNPLVPFDATAPKVAEAIQDGLPPETHPIPRIVDGGLPAVLSQTFRAMIHSRMVLGMTQYAHTYPNTDIILIEPDQRDPELYLANTFSYAQSRYMAEHAYQQTRRLLRSRKTGLSAKLWRHGITLHHDALDDPKRRLIAPTQYPTRVGQAISRLHMVMNDLGHIVRSEAHKESTTW
jgi:NTE family protein